MKQVGELRTKKVIDVSDVDMTALEVQDKTELPRKRVFDPNNIPSSDYEKVLAFLEANKLENGSIVMRDEIGTCTEWEPTGNGAIRPKEDTRVHLGVAKEWKVTEGVNAAGRYKRVTVDRAGFLAVVSIKNGEATIGQEWMKAAD